MSIVLLLRKPHFFGAEELRLAAQRAWHMSFAGGEGSLHCVAQSGDATLLKAGPHLLSFFHYPDPYIDNPRDQVDWLPQPSQRQAWIEHTACVGIDYLNSGVDVELGYCVLLQLAAEMLDGNCAAIYIPQESRLLPNLESLCLELRQFASSRHSGVNSSE
ncbi:MAG: hypothetical protein ACLQGV_17210 [Bryobacteraceae bacterium]